MRPLNEATGVSELDRWQAERAAHLNHMTRCTTLAMRAARNGFHSLSDTEHHDLLCFVGFDMQAFVDITRD